jgi:hypothetical protein
MLLKGKDHCDALFESISSLSRQWWRPCVDFIGIIHIGRVDARVIILEKARWCRMLRKIGTGAVCHDGSGNTQLQLRGNPILGGKFTKNPASVP